MSSRIVLVDPISDKLRKLFEGLTPGDYEFQCAPEARILPDLVSGASVLLTRHRLIDAELIQLAGPDLRLIQVMGRLSDRVDLEAAKRAGVLVATMPHSGAQAVAEHAMALILALSRQLVRGHLGVVAGDYRARGIEPVPTSEERIAFNWLAFDNVAELRGRTLGLVGFGEIGREVAWRARAFEMKLLYYQRRRIPRPYERLLQASYRPLDELMAESDFVSLHTPQTASTEGLIDRRRLALMRPGAYLINTARGAVVDQDALVESLRSRSIAGAGLDVFVEEPLVAGHPLTVLPNVVLAPHTGGGSGGGQRQHYLDILDNIERLDRGAPVRYIVE